MYVRYYQRSVTYDVRALDAHGAMGVHYVDSCISAAMYWYELSHVTVDA